MYRAYIKNLDDLELDFTDIPHEGHFIYGNLIKGGTYSDTDAIVGDLIEVTDEYVNPEWWCSIEKGSAEQSTGIKDLNGKGIYEGDVVHVVTEDGYERTGKVIFEKGCYRVDNGMDKYPVSRIGIKRDTLEILGSVHVNPELIDFYNMKQP